MGLLATIRELLAAPALAARPYTFSEASPWSEPNHLEHVTLPEDWPILGVSRAEAMAIPAVVRARNLIAPSIASLPMRAVRTGQPVEPQPTFLTRTDGPVSPFHRMLWTVDDLMFYGWSLWAVERGAGGQVLKADRVPYDDWDFDSEGRIQYLGRPVSQSEVVLIPGLDEGLLCNGRVAIHHARQLLAGASRAANNPSAHVELHQTGGEPLTDTQIDQLVERWAKARRGANGGVAYTSSTIEVKEHGTFDAHLLVEGRNAAAVEVARVTGIPAVMLDATVPEASMTYTNTDTRNTEFLDRCLAPYMAAITARLGMDDVVPAGTAVEFVTDGFTAPVVPTVSTPDDGHPLTPRPAGRPTARPDRLAVVPNEGMSQ